MKQKVKLKVLDKRNAMSSECQELLKSIAILIIPLIRGPLIGILIILVFFGGYFPWASSNLLSVLQVVGAIVIVSAIEYFST